MFGLILPLITLGALLCAADRALIRVLARRKTHREQAVAATFALKFLFIVFSSYRVFASKREEDGLDLLIASELLGLLTGAGALNASFLSTAAFCLLHKGLPPAPTKLPWPSVWPLLAVLAVGTALARLYPSGQHSRLTRGLLITVALGSFAWTASERRMGGMPPFMNETLAAILIGSFTENRLEACVLTAAATSLVGQFY